MAFLFKKKEKKVEEKPKPIVKDEALETEKSMHELSQKISVFDENIERYSKKGESLNVTIRNLLKEGKKPQAKAKLAELKQIQKAIDEYEKKKTILTDVRMKMEMGLGDKQMMSAMELANQQIKEQEKVNEKLNDYLLDYQEYSQMREETSQIYNQLYEGITNNEDLDKELDEIGKEVNMEKSYQINQDFNKVGNLNVNTVNQPAQKNFQEPQKQQGEKLDQLLADALS